MSEPSDLKSAGLSTGRLEALSDGVLAIVITLLVLSFADLDKGISDSPELSGRQLVAYLFGLWPHLLGYVLSFVLIAIYWIVHHYMFHHIRRADRGLLWLNLLFLMAVAFLPFPTDLLAECIYHESNAIVVLYGLSHAVAGLSLASVWLYATYKRRLVAADVDPQLIHATTLTALMGPAVYLVGSGLSFLSIPLAIGVFALAPVLYFFPGRVDRLWMSLSQTTRGAHPSLPASFLTGSRPWNSLPKP